MTPRALETTLYHLKAFVGSTCSSSLAVLRFSSILWFFSVLCSLYSVSLCPTLFLVGLRIPLHSLCIPYPRLFPVVLAAVNNPNSTITAARSCFPTFTTAVICSLVRCPGGTFQHLHRSRVIIDRFLISLCGVFVAPLHCSLFFSSLFFWYRFSTIRCLLTAASSINGYYPSFYRCSCTLRFDIVARLCVPITNSIPVINKPQRPRHRHRQI